MNCCVARGVEVTILMCAIGICAPKYFTVCNVEPFHGETEVHEVNPALQVPLHDV